MAKKQSKAKPAAPAAVPVTPPPEPVYVTVRNPRGVRVLLGGRRWEPGRNLLPAAVWAETQPRLPADHGLLVTPPGDSVPRHAAPTATTQQED